jgi:hypothetical protein
LFFKRLHHFEVFLDYSLLNALPLLSLCLDDFGLADFSIAWFLVLKKLIKPFLAIIFGHTAEESFSFATSMTLVNEWLLWAILINRFVQRSQWLNRSLCSEEITQVGWHILFSHEALHGAERKF